jgi:hypothetical protein
MTRSRAPCQAGLGHPSHSIRVGGGETRHSSRAFKFPHTRPLQSSESSALQATAPGPLLFGVTVYLLAPSLSLSSATGRAKPARDAGVGPGPDRQCQATPSS